MNNHFEIIFLFNDWKKNNEMGRLLTMNEQNEDKARHTHGHLY